MAISVDQVVLLFLLLLLSGFFSGSEVALVSLSKMKARHMFAQKTLGSSYIKRLKDNPNRMLSTILIGNNVVNVAASAIMTSLSIELFDSFAIGIATGVMTLLILVFGEITPKSIASQHNQMISQLVAPVIWYLSIVLAPVLNILDAFLNRFIKMLGIKSKEKTITEEEIRNIVTVAEQEGSIRAIEKNLIQRVFEFDEMNVVDIITPLHDMVVISSKAKINDALTLMLKTTHSRIPVYDKHKVHIVGLLFIKDVIKAIQNKKGSLPVSRVAHKPMFVPESKKISSLLRQFQRRSEQMALVVDEHGALKGLVTLEDVLEEIVGEIMDESDKIDPEIRKTGRNSWLVKGKADIEDVNSKIKIGLKGKDYDTFSGFIMKYTDTIPSKGHTFQYNGFRITIEERDKQRISLVRVEKI